jgi:hypothetical protein
MVAQTVCPFLTQEYIDPSPRRRILVTGSGTLLDQGVTELLSENNNLDIWNQPFESDDLLAQSAAIVNPDIIIHFHTEPGLKKRLIALLEQILPQEKLRIIIVHLRKNNLNVYNKQQWGSVGNENFLSIIYGALPT